MTTCRICHSAQCNDDCEELAFIYREQQREKLKDINMDDLRDECCYQCGGYILEDARQWGQIYCPSCELMAMQEDLINEPRLS